MCGGYTDERTFDVEHSPKSPHPVRVQAGSVVVSAPSLDPPKLRLRCRGTVSGQLWPPHAYLAEQLDDVSVGKVRPD